VLVGERVRLRPLAEPDLPLTRAWRNEDDTRSWFFDSGPVTEEQHAAWFRSYRDRDDDFVFVIEEAQGARAPLGQVSLYRIDWESARAECGRLIIRGSMRGRGLAREATRLLLDLAFGRLGLETVWLEVYADNARAIAAYEACGFVVTQTTGRRLTMTAAKPAR